MEEPFPRGRGTISSSESKPSSSSETKVKNEQQAKKKQDFLFGCKQNDDHQEPSSKKRKTGKSSKAKENPVTIASTNVNPLGGGAVIPPDPVKKRPAIIESVGFSKLQKNSKLLGVVRDVVEDYAIVSLPNMLTGFVRRGEVSKI